MIQRNISIEKKKGLVLSTQIYSEIDACDSFDVIEIQTPSVICWPTALNGNVRIYPIFNNPLCKKKETDCTRWRNSCDVFSMLHEAFV